MIDQRLVRICALFSAFLGVLVTSSMLPVADAMSPVSIV